MSLEPITMLQLTDAIEAAMRAYFGPRIAQYGFNEPRDPDTQARDPELKTPALLVNIEGIEDLEPADYPQYDHGPNCLVRQYDLAAHCILSVETCELQMSLPQFADQVCNLLRIQNMSGRIKRGNRWGFANGEVERPENISADPGGLPGLYGRDSWIVRWQQVAYVSDALAW